MTRSLVQPPDELRRLSQKLTLFEAEIRNLKLALQQLSTPSGLFRATQTVGVLPPSAGGTGTDQDVKGSVTIWRNASGSTRNPGDVVVENGDRTFTTTTIVGNRLTIGVVSDSIPIVNGANAHIRHNGYQAPVNVQGAVVVGNYLRTSATAGRAEDAGATSAAGVFAIALTASGGGASTVAAYVFPVEGGGSGSAVGISEDGGASLGNLTKVDFQSGFDVGFAAGVGTVSLDITELPLSLLTTDADLTDRLWHIKGVWS